MPLEAAELATKRFLPCSWFRKAVEHSATTSFNKEIANLFQAWSIQPPSSAAATAALKGQNAALLLFGAYHVYTNMCIIRSGLQHVLAR
jgi:hypothetical protein